MSPEDPRLAVLTGGRGTLARALAEQLTKEGWNVLSPGRDTLDVTDEGCLREWFRGIGPVDLLVNNAGCLRDALSVRIPEADWDAVLHTNLRGAFLCARAALPGMLKRRRGHLVQIGSFSARSGPVGQSAYAAAKAGLIGLTQSLAKEGGARGVRANTILPGYLKTPFTAKVPAPAEAAALARHVLGKFNTVEDAARFIVFLDSMKSVSGQVFQLDSRIAPWA